MLSITKNVVLVIELNISWASDVKLRTIEYVENLIIILIKYSSENNVNCKNLCYTFLEENNTLKMFRKLLADILII